MSQRGVNLEVLPQAFREALIADLDQRPASEEIGRRPSDDGATPASDGIAGSDWSVFRDAVTVCTRQMRAHDYYPEEVLVAVKSAVRAAGVGLLADSMINDLIRDAGQACIATYFEPETTGGSGAPARPPVSIPRHANVPGVNRLSLSPERRP